MWRRRGELRELEVDVLLVSFEPLERVRQYTIDDGFGWPVLSDEGGASYGLYGLGRASRVRAWLSPKTVSFYFRAALEGKRLRRPVSDTKQLGGDFLIDPEGTVVLVFTSKEPADRPSVDQIINARTAGGVTPTGSRPPAPSQ